MKSKLFPIVVSITISIFSCGTDLPEGTPACLDDHIQYFKKNSTCDHPKVNEYSFQNKTVYVFVQDCCCDQSSDVLDYECNKIGFLGGFIGNSVINGEVFSNATLIRTIWEKK